MVDDTQYVIVPTKIKRVVQTGGAADQVENLITQGYKPYKITSTRDGIHYILVKYHDVK